MAGWEVGVVVDGDAEDRPLRILGAHATGRLPDRAWALPRPHLLAVAVAT